MAWIDAWMHCTALGGYKVLHQVTLSRIRGLLAL